MSAPTYWQNKIYSQFRGVDYSTDATNISDARAADMLNMVSDEAGFPTKRLGWRELIDFNTIVCAGQSTPEGNTFPVNGIHYMKFQGGAGMWFIHVGKKLYAVPHIGRMRNILPDAEHLDVEYSSAFMPTQAHVTWLAGYVAGTQTATYDWQKANADMNGDGVVNGDDVKLLQALVDGAISPDQEGTSVTLVASDMANAQSSSFEMAGDLYLLDGQHYRRLKRKTVTSHGTTYYGDYELVSITGYIPTTGNHGYYFYADEEDVGTWVHCTLYEDANFLQTKQINEMAGDGTHKDFWLTTKASAINKVEILTAGAWTTTTAYTSAADGARTKITFTTAPAQHDDGAGIDNIRVTFTPVETLDPTVISKCTIAAKYGYFNDNRVYLSGNPDEPNKDWASGVDDPTYFPESMWTKIGASYSAIQGYLHYGDILAIIKEDTNADPEIYIRSYEVQEDQSVIFPVQQGVKGVGAYSRKAFASLRDDPLFYAKEGVYAISGTDASQQRTVQNRSIFVDNKLRQESGRPVACVWQDKYVLCFPDTGRCYVADARQTAASGESYAYEWYVWNNIFAYQFYEIDGDLYFGTKDGKLNKFNTDIEDLTRYSDGMKLDDGELTGGDPIHCYWITKADALGNLAEKKSLSRRGCTLMLKPYKASSVVATVTGDGIIVNQTVDDVAGEITSTVFPFEKSIKRFNTIQMEFKNDQKDEGFGIYGIQLRYVASRYIR